MTQLEPDPWMLLRARGWWPRWSKKSGLTFTHPRLAYPWKEGDALRLERERDSGDAKAVALLGQREVASCA